MVPLDLCLLILKVNKIHVKRFERITMALALINILLLDYRFSDAVMIFFITIPHAA